MKPEMIVFTLLLLHHKVRAEPGGESGMLAEIYGISLPSVS